MKFYRLLLGALLSLMIITVQANETAATPSQPNAQAIEEAKQFLKDNVPQDMYPVVARLTTENKIKLLRILKKRPNLHDHVKRRVIRVLYKRPHILGKAKLAKEATGLRQLSKQAIRNWRAGRLTPNYSSN